MSVFHRGSTAIATAPDPQPPSGSPPPPERRTRRPRNAGLPWILPAMIVSVGLLYYCIVYTGYISTLEWDGAAPTAGERRVRPTTPGWCADPVFWRSLAHTVVFFVVTFVVQVALGIVFACLLHSQAVSQDECTRS